MKVTMVETVRNIILKWPETADCDVSLLYIVHQREFHKINPAVPLGELPTKTYLKLEKEKKLSSRGNIERSRRKCQEDYPETRGKLYAKRHARQEDTLTSLGYNRR